MENSNNLDVLKTLRGKLTTYLESQGVNINDQGFFCCIHPDHPDRNPSVSLNYGTPLEGEVFHCFSGTGHDGNIFTAAHWLEGMPLVGGEFWDITVKTLAERFNVPYSPMEISEDQKRRYQALRSISDAVKVIKGMTHSKEGLRENHVGIKHLLERGINEESIRNFDIGVLTSKSAFDDAMTKLGHTDKEFLASKGLNHHSLLNRDGFIIPINDINGRPAGFVSRNCRMEANEHGTRKYLNSPNSDVYRKGEILFGYDKVKNKSGKLYIVEGYLDAIYLQQVGLTRSVALGSTSITDYHINKVLFDNDENDIVLCLDADDGGYEGTRLAIERLSPYKKFNIKILEMPAGYDPDSYVREFGLDSFLELPHISPFSWHLSHASYSDDMLKIAKDAIPTISAEESSVTRLSMIKELSNYTAIDEKEIKKDVDLLVNKKDNKYLQAVSEVNNWAQVKLNKTTTTDTRSILMEAMNKLTTVEDKYNNNKDMKLQFRDRLRSLRSDIIEGNYEYGLMAPRHKNIEKLLNGIPFKEKLIYFGGRGSAGKTAFMTSLALDVLEANPDCVIFYMSIDDSLDFLTTKMLAVRSGLATTEIQNYKNLKEDDKLKVDDAYSFIERHLDRLVISDSTDGNTVEVVENHLRWLQKEYTDKKIVFVLDNFHKLNMESGSGQKRDAISDTSSQLKDLAVKYRVCIMASVELRKLSNEAERPTRQDMQGSNKLDYDADVVGMVHNDYQVNRETSIIHEKNVNGKPIVMPWVEVNIVKNKVTGRLGECAFKYNSINMQFEEGDTNVFRQLRSDQTTRKIRFN